MAAKEAKGKPTAIVTVDNYSVKSYLLKDRTLAPLKKLSYKNNFFYSTYLANKDLIIAPVEVGVGIDNEDMDGLIEDRAYEELGLDPTQEYIIRYHEIDSDNPSKRLFQLFVIEQEKYANLLAPMRSKVKYIDLVVPAPMLYRSLYTMGIIESKKVHVFLYFGHNDTFATFYKNGKFLYSKSIQYSLDQIYDRYCEMIGELVDEKQFFQTLQKDGLKTLQSDFQQNLMKLFGEIFISINDIIIYTKRAYDLEVIDQIFIGSELGAIAGLDEYVQNYLGFHSTPLAFDFDIRSDEWHTDQLQYMLAATAFGYIESPHEQMNLTLYPKPPTFFKRPSGQMLIMAILALMAALALPIYHYVSASMNDIQTFKIQKEDKVIAQDVRKYKKILSTKKTEYDELSNVVKELSGQFTAKEKTLQRVYDKKVHYRLKSDQFAAFSNDLANYDVKTSAMHSSDDGYSIALVSSDDTAITKLIKAISAKYSDVLTSIDIQTIQKDNNSTLYRGILKMDLQ